MECSELPCGWKLPLRLKWAVYWSYVRPAILYGSETWCLKKSEIGIFRRTKGKKGDISCQWSVKGDGVGCVGVMVKEELCEKVVEVRTVSESDDSCCEKERGNVWKDYM